MDVLTFKAAGTEGLRDAEGEGCRGADAPPNYVKHTMTNKLGTTSGGKSQTTLSTT